MAQKSFDPNAAAAEKSGVFGLPHSEREARVYLLPVPFDATTSYGSGAAEGPQAIFRASKQIDLFDRQTGSPYTHGIFMPETPHEIANLSRAARESAEIVIAAGGLDDERPELGAAAAEVNRASAKVNAWVYDQTRARLAQGKLVGVVGGDHAAPFGAIQAHAEKYPGMGILHLDAHADLRPAYEGFVWSHASIMYNVIERVSGVAKLVQVAIRDFCEQEYNLITGSRGRIVTYFDADLAASDHEGVPWRKMADDIVGHLPENVYLSFDIDGLDPRLCPNTGTPVPGGLDFHRAVALMAAVRRAGKKIVGFDLTEVAPGAADNEWNANVGARLLYKMIGYALLG